MKKKLLYIGGILAVLALVFYFIFRNKSSQAQKSNGSSSSGGSSSGSANLETVNLPTADFPLKQGSYGKEVLVLQAYLNILDGADLELDGIFGGNTFAAVKNHNWNGNYTLINLNEVNKFMYKAYVAGKLDEINIYLLSQGIQLI